MNIRSITKHIPNSITSLNLICGIIAIILAFDSNYIAYAPFFVFAGAIFDFLDGLAARIFKAYSELGKQLDSLTDLVTFGVAPGILAFQMINITMFNNTLISDISKLAYSDYLLLALALSLPVSAAFRLAKFNIDENQKSTFIGLPTPAAGIFVSGLALILFSSNHTFLIGLLSNKAFFGMALFMITFLMVSNIPMFSLKLSNLNWSENWIQFLFLIISLILLVMLHIFALPVIILVYIIISIFTGIAKLKKL